MTYFRAKQNTRQNLKTTLLFALQTNDGQFPVMKTVIFIVIKICVTTKFTSVTRRYSERRPRMRTSRPVSVDVRDVKCHCVSWRRVSTFQKFWTEQTRKTTQIGGVLKTYSYWRLWSCWNRWRSEVADLWIRAWRRSSCFKASAHNEFFLPVNQECNTSTRIASLHAHTHWQQRDTDLCVFIIKRAQGTFFTQL